MARVEGLPVAILLAATLIVVWRSWPPIRRGAPRPIDWILLPAVAAIVWQAAFSAYFHKMVPYGRVIHPWMVFMALALASVLERVRRPALRTAAFATVAGCTAITFAFSACDYHRLAYPPDVLYALGSDTDRVRPERANCELTRDMYDSPYASPAPLDRDTRRPYLADANFLLINFCQPRACCARRRRRRTTIWWSTGRCCSTVRTG